MQRGQTRRDRGPGGGRSSHWPRRAARQRGRPWMPALRLRSSWRLESGEESGG
jgi:hypothetical protein